MLRARRPERRRPQSTRTASGSVAVPQREPGSPAPAGSSSRAGTTPSSSRRSGATTCGSRASSSSTSTASTTWPTTCVTSPQARRVGSACWSTTSCRAARKPASPSRSPRAPSVSTCGSSGTRSSTSGRRSSPSASASTCGRRFPGRSRGSTASASSSAGRTRPGRHRAGLEAHPVASLLVHRPRTSPARPGRGAHRLRDGRPVSAAD